MDDTGTALVEALLYGRLDGLSPETVFLYSRTGLLHLFSASGFHMGVALMMAEATTRLLGPLFPSPLQKYLAFCLSLSLMTFFGSVTDWSSPLVRAYAFTTLLAGAKLWEVKPSKAWVFALSLAAAAILGKGSWLSFSLSAFGMAGVLLTGGKNLFSLAIGPWLFTTPLVIWYFSIFSLSAPFWNLSIGLLISWTVLPLAIADLVLSACGFPWRGLFTLACAGMEQISILLSKGDSYLGLAYWVNPKHFLPYSFCLAAAILFFLRRPKRREAKMLLCTTLMLPLLFPQPKLAVLDVGQGDAIFLRLENDSTLLVDAGPAPWKKYPAAVNKAFERVGISAVDNLLISHSDRDHIGGIPSFLSRHRVQNALWMRVEVLRDPKILPVLAAAERADINIQILNKSIAPGIRCWLPPAVSSNEGSPFCHARLKGGKTIWLTGDGGHRSEKWLLQQSERLPRADFLKLGHHGSKGSSSTEFLLATGANTALLSAGKKNRYGHPASEVVNRLKRLGLFLHRTDQEGSLLWH